MTDPDRTAQAASSSAPRDRIALTDYVREVEIGAFQAERGVTQRVRFHVAAEVTPDAEAVVADDVDGILSYDTLLDAVEAELAAQRVDLLETLAERIAARVLTHDRAARVHVTIQKLDRGPFVLGVEIARSRVRAPLIAAPEDPPPRPYVVLVDEVPRDLRASIDALPADAPAILVAVPSFAAPRAANALAQRRIDLLAIEQAAWQLAANDPRCVVRTSRTELDWALRQGELSVWAPSRMVLDATDPPEDAAPATLARWLAAQFDALGTRRLP